jgi:hypothetical protein
VPSKQQLFKKIRKKVQERCKLSFVAIASKKELSDETMKGATANGIPVLIVNLGGKYYAIGNTALTWAANSQTVLLKTT